MSQPTVTTTVPSPQSSMPPASPPPAARTRFIPHVIAALCGIVIARAMFGDDILFSTSQRWVWPPDDHAAYVSALLYYLHAPWRVPLFNLPALGYPEGGSIILNDGIPLGALGAKLLYSAVGVPINHVAAWPLLAYALQGLMGVRFAMALGERSPWIAVCLAIWALLFVPLLQRFGHIALLSQFLLLWALALYAEQVSGRRAPAMPEQVLLVVVAALINPYLCAMVIALSVATVATLWKDGRLRRGDYVRAAGAGTAGLLALALVGAFSTGESAFVPQVGGVYSWNPLSMVVSKPVGIWEQVTGGIPLDATGGQYEGMSYLGLGPLLVGLVCLALQPRSVGRATRRHWVLAVTLAACAAFAASHRVYVGAWHVMDMPLPRVLLDAEGMFRSQGRFVWPLLYVLLFAPAVLLLRGRYRAWGILLVAVATLTQAVEARPYMRWCREAYAAWPPLLVDAPQLTGWLQRHERLWQYPSWWCGSQALVGRDVQLQVQVLAARLAVPNNSVYTSRPLKDCAQEQQWAAAPAIEAGTLYVFMKGAVTASSPLAEAIAGVDCRDIGWATACSRSPLAAMPPARDAGRSWFTP